MTYVQVCDQSGEPLDFRVMGLNVKDGIFQSINTALTAVKLLMSCGEKFNKIYVFHLNAHDFEVEMIGGGVFFDEYIQIPENININFKCGNNINKAVIRAIHLKQGACLGLMNKTSMGDPAVNDIQIQNIIDGVIKNNDYGYSVFYQENMNPRSECLEDLHRSVNAEVLAAGLIQNYVKTVQSLQPLTSLFRNVKHLTSNFHVLTALFCIEDSFTLFIKELDELDELLSKNVPIFKQFLCEDYVQELLETMSKPKMELYRSSTQTSQLMCNMSEYLHVRSPTTPPKQQYEHLSQVIDTIEEHIFIQRQILKKVMKIDLVHESIYKIRLRNINMILKVIQAYLDSLRLYMIHTDNENILVDGENTSELLLNLATQALQGSHATVFKKALITFLNEKSPTKIPEDSVVKNSELIAHLRTYLKNCPDADYAVIRFMKNHPSSITGIQTGLSILSSIGSLSASTMTILKLFGFPVGKP